MNVDRIFENLNVGFNDLWKRLQEFADDLDLTNEDQEIFISEDGSKLAYYINSYGNSLISVGVHLARVKKIRQKMQNKAERVLGSAYVAITEEGPPHNVSVSKFDQEYRKGKALENREYQEVTKLVADLCELETILDAVKVSLSTKATVLPTMFKLEKDKF